MCEWSLSRHENQDLSTPKNCLSSQLVNSLIEKSDVAVLLASRLTQDACRLLLHSMTETLEDQCCQNQNKRHFTHMESDDDIFISEIVSVIRGTQSDHSQLIRHTVCQQLHGHREAKRDTTVHPHSTNSQPAVLSFNRKKKRIQKEG